MKLIKSFVHTPRCFGSYFDVIFLMYLVSSGFSFIANLILIIILIDPVQPRVSAQKSGRKTFNKIKIKSSENLIIVVHKSIHIYFTKHCNPHGMCELNC